MDAIQKKLNKLKLTGMAETLEQRFEQAMQEKWSYSNLLEVLLSDEIERRNNRQLMTRLSKSRLNLQKTLETFDFKFNTKIEASLIKELSSCDFLKKNQNIFILGPSGVGKSHLAQLRHRLGSRIIRPFYSGARRP